MAEARVKGRVVSLSAAIAEAIQCLGRARFPVVAGLECDVAGIRAGIALARYLRGAIDHAASASVLKSLSVMQRGGWMCVSPAEISRRCDLIFCVGSDLPGLWLNARFPHRTLPEVVHLKKGDITENLACLSAIVAGTSAARIGRTAIRLEALAARLQQAQFGVAVWSPSEISEPMIELLMRLVTRLNESTRFSALPFHTGTQAESADLVSGWMCGFPVRTSWAAEIPEHDPWAYAADRLVDSGEADAVVWISSLDSRFPAWIADVPTIALVPEGAQPTRWPRVTFEVGRPAVDHDAVLYSGETSTFGWNPAQAVSEAPTAESIIERLRVGLEAMEPAA